MQFEPTPLKGAFVITPEPFSDHRGSFMRIYCKQELEAVGVNKEIVQANHSVTIKKGAVRGMHYQRPPKAEIKIVKCIQGAVFDVIIDLRKNSPTFCRWCGETISAKNMKMMVIPEGFAHGFQVLESKSELLYFHTQFYSPDHEGGLCFDDPAIGIKWPLEVIDVSDRDRSHPLVDSSFKGISL